MNPGATVTVPFGTGRIPAEIVDAEGSDKTGRVTVMTLADESGNRAWMSVPVTDIQFLEADA